jgi:hypothetical protein
MEPSKPQEVLVQCRQALRSVGKFSAVSASSPQLALMVGKLSAACTVIKKRPRRGRRQCLCNNNPLQVSFDLLTSLNTIRLVVSAIDFDREPKLYVGA